MGNAVDIFFASGTPSPFDVFEDERRLADRVLYCGHFRRTRPVVVELDQLASARSVAANRVACSVLWGVASGKEPV